LLAYLGTYISFELDLLLSRVGYWGSHKKKEQVSEPKPAHPLYIT